MESDLERTDPFSASLWQALLWRGLLLLLIGIIALLFPLGTLISLTIFFGAIMAVDGLMALLRLRCGGGAYCLARGLLGLLLGILILLMPLLATLVNAVMLLVALAVLALVSGAADLVTGLSPGRRHLPHILWGVLLLISGAAILAIVSTSPAAFLALAWIIGIYAVFAGLTLVSRALLLRAATKRAALPR